MNNNNQYNPGGNNQYYTPGGNNQYYQAGGNSNYYQAGNQQYYQQDPSQGDDEEGSMKFNPIEWLFTAGFLPISRKERSSSRRAIVMALPWH